MLFRLLGRSECYTFGIARAAAGLGGTYLNLGSGALIVACMIVALLNAAKNSGIC